MVIVDAQNQAVPPEGMAAEGPSAMNLFGEFINQDLILEVEGNRPPKTRYMAGK